MVELSTVSDANAAQCPIFVSIATKKRNSP